MAGHVSAFFVSILFTQCLNIECTKAILLVIITLIGGIIMPTKDSTISVRIDSELKASVQQDLEKMGLDLSTYIIMALKAVNRTHELPFKPSALSPLEEALADVKAGRVTKAVSLEDYLKEVKEYPTN